MQRTLNDLLAEQGHSTTSIDLLRLIATDGDTVSMSDLVHFLVSDGVLKHVQQLHLTVYIGLWVLFSYCFCLFLPYLRVILIFYLLFICFYLVTYLPSVCSKTCTNQQLHWIFMKMLAIGKLCDSLPLIVCWFSSIAIRPQISGYFKSHWSIMSRYAVMPSKINLLFNDRHTKTRQFFLDFFGPKIAWNYNF